ncbi:RpiB/LacA/LacB family sugar-phosphate isomerase [Streptomyces katsurahamanus]|uniref:RpiB/LacA/LacB family sugar-phosphate isomerase n=1 Tax=Streptomyces katsurahamanus TaxID=2577098 RepID=A0ABW9NWA7_9ACTN|nr:RpiB/LacA/LacB family sugar-phosphate isomerase [Streptomyces katsurahamanus]MQS37540.1 RpiB/LacA/LacB family sugar-phosphate isomerase [Streptomyces katsurahamanus]
MRVHRKKLRLVVGSDAAGREYKNTLAADLRASPLVATVIDVGSDDRTRRPYPEVAFAAGQLIAAGQADRALLVCHTGLGMAIAASKVRGIRAVTAHDPLSVRASVLSNNAQVLAFGQGVIGLDLARSLAAAWLTHRFEPASSAAVKIEAIRAFEHQHSPAAATSDQPR